jgi:3'-phosphoadenosine 5'-phosphosulfate sulfotransferase (PAPS reductase)/FAD synthetase
MQTDDRLKACVADFFKNYLDYQEESDDGKLFNPVTISCCRVLKVKALNALLDEMKQLSNS